MRTFGLLHRPSLQRIAWLLTLALTTSSAAADISLSANCALARGPARAVTHVLDGETIRLDDGSEVRLINILAPRASDVGAPRDAWPLQEAARQALASLVQGQSVVLAFDEHQRVDRYRRWLAHVVVEKDGATQWVQASLLTQGMARAHGTPEHAACIADLLLSERTAREAGRGLWSNAAYHVRSAARPEELLPYRHTFQLVSGYVRRVSRGRGTVAYLNFGRGRRSDFSIVVKAKTQPLHGNADPLSLRGRTVLVRGWIDRRVGPMIEIDEPNQLEVIADQPPITTRAVRRSP